MHIDNVGSQFTCYIAWVCYFLVILLGVGASKSSYTFLIAPFFILRQNAAYQQFNSTLLNRQIVLASASSGVVFLIINEITGRHLSLLLSV